MPEATTTYTGWRDSNWYIALVDFVSKYKRHRMGVIGIAILIMFVGIAIAAPYIVPYDPTPSNKVAPPFLAPAWMQVFDPLGVVTKERIDNQYLEAAPNVTIVGENQDRFSSVHHPGAANASYLNMTWSHVAGQELDFYETLDSTTHPDCMDFIYMSDTFKWEFQSMPSDVNMTLDYGVTMTGDFKSQTYGGLMFKIYIYLIDSSGNWWKVYESFPPYSTSIQNRRIDLSFFDIVEGWQGMVSHLNQTEDPTNELTVAVALAPTDNFRQRRSPANPILQPYLNYTGSVTVQLKRLSMIAYGDYFGILGTTDKGADAFSQLLWGTRISLTIGILATAISTVVGVVVGMTAGYFGGKLDEILMRIVDFLLVIPGLPLMMVLAAFLGPTIENIIVVISILGWTGTSRLIRSQVMAEKNKAYVESAKAIGASDTYIIYRHILPNVTPILFADITLGVVGAILSESGLAFLGLTDPSQPSWGRMLADAQAAGGFSNGAWWVVIFPGLMITILSLAFTFVGHTLDQVLNPRLIER
jgi:peptide/nickel transport system permease protein